MATCGLKAWKVPQDGQQPCFTPKGRAICLNLLWPPPSAFRSHRRTYTATVRFLPCFTAVIYVRLRPLPLSRPAVVGDFPCFVDVPHRFGRRTMYYTAHLSMQHPMPNQTIRDSYTRISGNPWVACTMRTKRDSATQSVPMVCAPLSS